MKKKVFISILTLMIYNLSYGKNKQYQTSFENVILEGRIIGSKPISNLNAKQHIYIMISKYPFTYLYQGAIKNSVYEAELKENENFKFIIPAPAERFYMYILHTQGKNKGWSSWTNEYMLEEGDSIRCELSDSLFKFFGKGSEKLNCQSEIFKLGSQGHANADLLRNRQESKYITITDNMKDSVLLLQKKTLEKYSPNLTSFVANYLLANCYGLRYFEWLRAARIQFLNPDNPYYNINDAFIKSQAYKNVNFSLIEQISDKAIASSYIYTDFIFQKILVDQIIKSNCNQDEIRSDEYWDAIFETIKNNFSGILRDKLICLFILENRRMPLINRYFDKAIELINSLEYKEVINEIKSKSPSGTPFFKFSLENSAGQMTKLSDFDDKVVLLDFWFTGCSPCRNLKSAMQPIFDKYKTNPKVVFISISTDKDISTWKNSIKEGTYTDVNAINLFTGGEGVNHALIKHYNITGFPTIYLLKNGKIYASPLPRPNLVPPGIPTTGGNTAKLISLMEQALKTLSK